MQIEIDPLTKPTMSVDETAFVLGIGRATAYQAVRTGQIPSIKVGRRLRVPTAILVRMLGLDADAGQAVS